MSKGRMLAAAVALAMALTCADAWAGPTAVETGSKDQDNAAVGTGGVAWTVWAKLGHYGYWVYANTGGSDFLVNPGGTWGSTGGIDGNTLVYQRVDRRGSDLAAYDLATQKQLKDPAHANSKYWEWGPSVSGDWVLFNRNNINYGQSKEWQDVLLVNTVTGEKRLLDKSSAKLSLVAGQVNGNWAVWNKWTKSGSHIYLYDITAKTKTDITPPGNLILYSPAVADDSTVYYSQASGNTCGRGTEIDRRLPDGTTAKIAQFPNGTDAWAEYEFTDSTPAQNLYYTQETCKSKYYGVGDIYLISGADTAPPILKPVNTGPRTPERSPKISPPWVVPQSAAPEGWQAG